MTTFLFYFACFYAVVSTGTMIVSICFLPMLMHHSKYQRLRFRFHWKYYDFWIGLFYDNKKQSVWLGLFPMLMLHIWLEDVL